MLKVISVHSSKALELYDIKTSDMALSDRKHAIASWIFGLKFGILKPKI
jgi:hypothetical protein